MNNSPVMNLAGLSLIHYDILLYLDTHPCDEEAIKAYKAYGEMCCEAKKEYEKKYGALTFVDDEDANYFNWACGPLPWEGGIC